MYQNEGAWSTYVKDAVAIHFTWVKPWATEDKQYPFDLWHQNLARAQRLVDGLPLLTEEEQAASGSKDGDSPELESESAKLSATQEKQESSSPKRNL